MTVCPVCERPLDGSADGAVHAECLARRLPQDALVAAVAALVLVLAPPVVIWAG
jgi:hypothetical protein